MTDKKKNGWMRFVPSLDLPKERVSIAYDTHDERGVRYTYGHFQFYNGSCGCFWKDGNEQPKVVKAEDIKYWMPVPSLDAQEEPKECMYSKDNYTDEDRKVLCDGCEEECKMGIKSKHATGKLKECIDNVSEESLAKARKQLEEELVNGGLDLGCGVIWKDEKSVSEDLEEAVNAYIGYTPEVDESSSTYGKRQAFKAGANWQEQKDESYTKSMYKVGINTGKELMKRQMMAKAVDAVVKVDAGGYPYIPQMELYDYDKDIPLAKEGDKYKVILIKEG